MLCSRVTCLFVYPVLVNGPHCGHVGVEELTQTNLFEISLMMRCLVAHLTFWLQARAQMSRVLPTALSPTSTHLTSSVLGCSSSITRLKISRFLQSLDINLLNVATFF